MNRAFKILLIAYILLASLYSVVTPIFEASDELWHYPMVKYLADHALALPVQDPNVATAWRQEGSQPPLYYMLGAILTFRIDTSDLDKVRKLNPHADIGIVVPDGNYNMVVHDPAVESFPWRGTVLAVHLVRFLSVALGAVTVTMTYLLTCELFPVVPSSPGPFPLRGKGRNTPLPEGEGLGVRVHWLALAAAAFVAFNPMFLFISGSVNNDNLSNVLASVLLVLIARMLKRTDTPSVRELIVIGVTAGAGMLAKFNIGFLLPLIALSLAILAYRLRSWRVFIMGSAITGLLTIGIASWWYIRNMQLYGDPTGLNMFIRIVGPRNIPANWAQLWSERHTFLMSYWGFFGGVNVPLPDVVYTIFNGIAALAAVGVIVGVARGIANPHPKPLPHKEGGASAPGIPLPSLWGKGQGMGGNWPILLGRLFTAIWIVVLFAGLIRWTTATWASQGRLIFTAIAPLSMWMAWGLWQLGRPVPLVRWRLAGIGVWGFVVVAAIAPVDLSHKYFNLYALNSGLYSDFIATPPHYFGPADAVFCETAADAKDIEQRPCLHLMSSIISLTIPSIHVGEYFSFSPIFTILQQPFTQDWSAFIHLENKDGVIVAQRDVYLGQGQFATSLLSVAEQHKRSYVFLEWRNRFAVLIPDYAYAPQTLRVYLGFYNVKTGQRMKLYGSEYDDTASNRALLGAIQILPRESSLNIPNPMSVNFGDEAELVGYDVSRLVMYPNSPVKVTFYWRAKHPITTDYRVFTQILEPNTTHVFGADDSMPVQWTRPTHTWQPGEIIKDEHIFTVNKDAPPGTWQIAVGMYELMPDQQFRRLRIITPDGGEANDILYLTRVKINLPPDDF